MSVILGFSFYLVHDNYYVEFNEFSLVCGISVANGIVLPYFACYLFFLVECSFSLSFIGAKAIKSLKLKFKNVVLFRLRNCSSGKFAKVYFCF